MTSNDWPRVRLAELSTKVGSGSTPRGGEDAYKSSGTPLIRSMNVVFFGFKREGLAFIDAAQADLLRGAEVRANDVLLNITGASIGRVTLAPEDLQGSRVNQHVCIIRPIEALDPRYLRAFLSSPEMQAQINSEQYGVTRQALTKEQILGFEVPLAPPAEQKRIADKLDALLARVNACRARLDRVPGILKRFRQSVLAAATSGELTREWREERRIGFEWQHATVGELIDRIDAGLNVKCEERPPTEQERGLVKISAVTWGTYDDNESKTLPANASVPEQARIRAGDFLISRANTLELVGACVIAQTINRPVFLSDKVLRLVMTDDLKPWLLLVLQSPTGRMEIEQRASGNQLSMRNLPQASLKQVPVPIPTPEERTEIVRRAGTLLALAAAVEQRCRTERSILDRLTPAILAKAFRGELVPQDPNDAPASDLLAQIHRDAEPQSNTRPGRPSKRSFRKITRTETNMLTRKDVSSNYLASILKQRGPLEAEALWVASEMAIDDFYDQLKEEEAQALLREKRSDGDRAARMLEAVA